MAITRINNNQITDSVAGNLFLGVNAAVKVQDFTITSTKIANNLTYNSDLTVTGNLTVQGNTTAIDTINLVVEDPLILLAKEQTGAPALDIGFIGKRGTEDNIAFVWDESADQFVAVFTTSEVTNSTISINSYASLQVLDLTAANANITGNLTFNGTIDGNVDVTGNITGGNLISDAAINGMTITASGNLEGNNAVITNDVSANTGTFTGNVSGDTFLGNIDGATGVFTGNVSGDTFLGNIDGATGVFTGNVSGDTFLGNIDGATGVFTGNVSGDTFLGNIDGATGVFTGNVSADTVLANVDGATGTFTGNVSGDTFLGNIDGATGVFTGNVSGDTFLGNIDGDTGTFTGNVSGDTFLGNIDGATGTFTGNVSGDTFLGNIDGATGVFTGNISGGNIAVTGELFGATLETTGNALIGGNLVVQGNLTYINIDDLRVEDPIIILGTGPNGAPLTVNDGRDRGIYMEYFISDLGNAFVGFQNASGNMIIANDVEFSGNDVVQVNSFGNLNVGNLFPESIDVGAGNITAGNLNTGGQVVASGNVSGDTFLGNIDGDTGTFTGNVSGDTFLGNIDGATGTFTGNVSGDTFLGNIDGATGVFTGNVSGDTFLGNVDGATGVFTGNVSGGNITTAGNVDGANINATAGITAGTTVIATGNVSGGNITTAGAVDATGNVTGGNVNTGGTVVATGNVDGGNVNTGGQVVATGNVTGGNVNTAGTVVATGNVDAGNVNSAGQVVATGNVTGGNLVTTGTADLGNIRITGDDITNFASNIITINSAASDIDVRISGDTVANLLLTDAGTDTVVIGGGNATVGAALKVDTTDSMMVPVGNTIQRPGTPEIGMFRFNTGGDALEVYTSGGWEDVGVPAFTVIVADAFVGDGSTLVFTLSANSTTAGSIVSINGIVQEPTTAYSVSGVTLTFTEAPAVSDNIDARILTTTTTVTNIENSSGNAVVEVLDSADTVQITGNVLPLTSNTYNLGSSSLRWNELFLEGSTITLGNVVIKNTGGNTVGFFGPDGTTPGAIDTNNIDSAGISNGTSSLAVIASGGNIRANVGGSTVGVFSSTGLVITGSIEATNGFIGLDASKISNGTSNVSVVASNGNVDVNVGGNPIVTFYSGGIDNRQSNGVGNIGTASSQFNTIFAKATSAQYADLAEMYEADAAYEPGTVLCFGGPKEVTQCGQADSTRVAGVVSTNPSYLMNSGQTGDNVVAVALQGRVPCRVTGTIRKGDLIVAAGDGRARANNAAAVGTVIGKALADFDGADGVIEVVVGRV